MVTKCYLGDQVGDYNSKYNPVNTINFSELSYRNLLMTNDRIQCVSRFVWDDLPNAFESEDIETMLYSYGSICCFLDDNNLIFSPFTLSGELDKKGNLYNIQPLTLDGKKAYGNKKRCYSINGEFDYNDDACIIIQDYTGCIQINNNVSRETLNSTTTINDEVKTYRILLYNIILSINKLVVNCENEEQAKIVISQAKQMLDPQQPIVAVSGDDLLSSIKVNQYIDKLEIDEIVRAIEFYNKKRRHGNGVPAPDTFEKKERLITQEIENTSTHTNLILWDGLRNRQKAAKYINKCFGTNISVDINPILGGVI